MESDFGRNNIRNRVRELNIYKYLLINLTKNQLSRVLKIARIFCNIQRVGFQALVKIFILKINN